MPQLNGAGPLTCNPGEPRLPKSVSLETHVSRDWERRRGLVLCTRCTNQYSFELGIVVIAPRKIECEDFVQVQVARALNSRLYRSTTQVTCRTHPRKRSERR